MHQLSAVEPCHTRLLQHQSLRAIHHLCSNFATWQTSHMTQSSTAGLNCWHSPTHQCCSSAAVSDHSQPAASYYARHQVVQQGCRSPGHATYRLVGQFFFLLVFGVSLQQKPPNRKRRGLHDEASQGRDTKGSMRMQVLTRHRLYECSVSRALARVSAALADSMEFLWRT